MRRFFVAFAVVAMLLSTQTGRARACDVTLSDVASLSRASLGLDRTALDTSSIYAPSDLRLRGAGTFTGFRIDGLVTACRLRFGVNASIGAVGGLGVTLAPRLARDLSVTVRSAEGGEFGGSFGYGWDFGRVEPHVDLLAGVGLVNLELDLHSRAIGDLPTIKRSPVLPLFAARLGTRVMFSEHVGVDVSGTFSPVGYERASLLVGFAFWGDLTREMAKEEAAKRAAQKR